MAIGARRTSVAWLVMRQTLVLGVAGLAFGIPLVFGVKSFIVNELYGIQGSDPSAIGAAIVLLLAVVLAAGSWPAWRASRLDPMVCLRHE
jgi:ABC-type antimicrobial peptide transport system permease subunit